MPHLTLLQLNQIIQSVLNEQLAANYWVIAEIGDMRITEKGHCYLELVERDQQQLVAKLRANLWAYDFHNLNSLFRSVTGQPLKSGMKILARVMVQFHELYGLSLLVKDLDPSFTLGERARQRQLVIDRLKQEGIIHQNTQIPLPLVPQRIAVVSSKTAAGYGDFVHQLVNNEEKFHFQIDLFKTTMQGDEAIPAIVSAMNKVAARYEDFDVLVIIRGGGSQVDLDCFDSYQVAASIAQCPLPVITGIGHLRDDTIADMVANTKMKTPTAVAEFMINGMKAFEAQLTLLIDQIRASAQDRIQTEKTRLFGLLKGLDHGSKTLIKLNQHYLGLFKHRLLSGIDSCMNAHRNKLDQSLQVLSKQWGTVLSGKMKQLEVLEARITMANPENILKRGYSITYLNGKVINQNTIIKNGDELETKLYAKIVSSRVSKVRHEGGTD